MNINPVYKELTKYLKTFVRKLNNFNKIKIIIQGILKENEEMFKTNVDYNEKYAIKTIQKFLEGKEKNLN